MDAIAHHKLARLVDIKVDSAAKLMRMVFHLDAIHAVFLLSG